MELAPYIYFTGQAEEALEFYTKAFNGSIIELNRYAQMPDICKDLPIAWQNKLMHASFKADNVFFMVSDIMPSEDHPFGVTKIIPAGSPISLALNFTSKESLNQIFDKLVLGGVINMPLADTFWGAYFGMLTDKFGIKWMFNYDYSPS